MIPNLNVQEIHDTMREVRAHYGIPDNDRQTDWHALYLRRGERLLLKQAQLEEMTRQRDMLARRCAEQANHIAGLLELQAEDAAESERHPLADAIAVMQRSGVR
jgi:hypothetical protein